MQQPDTTHFGVHYMLDGYGADFAVLNDEVALTKLLKELPGRMNMYAISEPVISKVGPNNKKDPGGISGFVMIAESHISFHTFPGREFVTIDVYTCQDKIDSKKLTEEFTQFFKLQEVEERVIERATKYPVKDLH